MLGGEGVAARLQREPAGVRPDEVKTFTRRYPEDFNAKGLAGKTIEYTATVTAVAARKCRSWTTNG